jgi:hypothetical protein
MLENQIKYMAFLTNIPYINKGEKKLKLNSLKNYKNEQNMFVNKINFGKKKENEMDEISLIKTSKSKIDNNIFNHNVENSNSLEKKLNDTLKEIKEQIKLLSNNTERINIKDNQKLVLNIELI